MKRKIDWAQFGYYLKLSMDFFTIVRDGLKKKDVGPEILEYITEDEQGKICLQEAIEAVADKYCKHRAKLLQTELVQRVPLKKGQKKPLVAEVDLDVEPEAPFEGAILKMHLKQGKVFVEYRPDEDELYVDGVKVVPYRSKAQKEGQSIKGTDLQPKALSNRPINARLADFLYENQQFIPRKWQGEAWFFWGTDWCDLDGYRCVRYLCWDGSRWERCCVWLEGDWYSYSPSASLAS